MAARGQRKKTAGRTRRGSRDGRGRLRIGNQWNAITIIALSQNSPLKAIAEFVENSIDARARNITIIRGREQGEPYLRVVDDGEGIRLNDDGVPDFDYVATHVCDSIKRRLKERGATGIQGEFGIGLLSFWTVGERMVLSSAGADGRVHDMEMEKGAPHYRVTKRRLLFEQPGTELLVKPLLPGIRQLNPERIQAFLASELRERIRSSGVRIRIKDRRARKDLEVVPREFTGRLLREIGPVGTPDGSVEVELYVGEAQAEHRVALFRNGTRVVPDVSRLQGLEREPWTSDLLRGLIDAPFLQLTPGTRDGVVFDARFAALSRALEEIEPHVIEQVERERAAAEEEASRSILRSVRKALTEGLLALPNADYQWLEVNEPRRTTAAGAAGTATSAPGDGPGDTPLVDLTDAEGSLVPEPNATAPDAEAPVSEERAFHEHAGPLYKVTVSPASAVVKVGETCTIRCLPKDRRGRAIEAGVEVSWQVVEGAGSLRDRDREVVTFAAPAEPGLSVIRVTARQQDSECSADASVTITESLGDRFDSPQQNNGRGIPRYTYRHAPGELWRSRYDAKNNLIVVNNGHSDYRYAADKRARKLRYMLRLYAKELVLENFPGYERGELLERMIELSLYAEEHLR
ncbi:MAG: ATP-binding protein [Spirochaetaceae bacterium]|nr:ATP-binding protein [Spirochaetaceae bacterium]